MNVRVCGYAFVCVIVVNVSGCEHVLSAFHHSDN